MIVGTKRRVIKASVMHWLVPKSLLKLMLFNKAFPIKGLQGWGLLSQFHPFRYFLHFQHCQNTRTLLNITFIFDRCHRSSAVVAPVKYNCDSSNSRDTFAGSKILLTGKLLNGALVTPTPINTVTASSKIDITTVHHFKKSDHNILLNIWMYSEIKLYKGVQLNMIA